MQVTVSWGRHSMSSDPKPNNNGATEWFQLLSRTGLEEDYPSDASQAPDVFIYLTSSSSSNPCSFYRFTAKELLAKGFSAGPQWITLSEDKGLDLLNDGDFPGSVLLQIGFGTADDWLAVRSHWNKELKEMTHRTPFRLRCHLFQARELPQVDFAGSIDAYLKVNFNGFESKKTDVVRDSLDPTYYKTIEFDCALPKRKFAPQVFVQIWDYDYMSEHDYIGCFSVDLSKEAVETKVTANGERSADSPPFPDPKWYSLMRETPGDCEGQVLASFELIAKSTPDQLLAPPASLVPKTRKAVIDIIALGLRGLVPYGCYDMQLPYASFEFESMQEVAVVDKASSTNLNLVGVDLVKESAETEKSKTPTPSNPNFLQHIQMEVMIPENAVFASPLKVFARDTRLGGLVRPVVGCGKIRLEDKIPWSKTYKSSATKLAQMGDMANELNELAGADDATLLDDVAGDATNAALANTTAVGGVEESKVGEKAPLLSDDAFVAPPADLDTLVKAATPKALDNGAGVFGALLHVRAADLAGARKTTKRKKGLLNRVLGGGGGDSEDEGAENASKDEEYEEEEAAWRKDRPVLRAELEDELNGETPFETYELSLGSKVGTVMRNADYRIVGRFKGIVRVLLPGDSGEGAVDLKELLKPHGVKVRLYCVRGVGLVPKDATYGGRPGKSDPYIKCELGKNVFDDRKNYVDDATDVDLYKCVEFNTELPGASQLKIDLLDYDEIGFKDDLIGRTVIDLEDRWFLKRWRTMGQDLQCDEIGATRFAVKPLERRALYADACTNPQGTLECWLDLLTPGENAAYPPDDISLPPRLGAEVRLVVWKARDMVNMDTITNMNDLYVKCWMEDCEPQCTDIHWRAKGGKGSWNWRMKFDVELGHNTKVIKFPYLHVQAWDQDILKWNDIIAESVIDLGRYLKKCYRKRQTIKLFEGMGGVKKSTKSTSDGDNTAPGGAESGDGEEDGLLPPSKVRTPNDPPVALVEAAGGGGGGGGGKKGKKKKKKKVKEEPKPPSMCWRALGGCWSCCCAGRGREVEATGADTKDAASKESSADDDTQAFITQIKESTGWGDTDPKSSSWLYMDKLDHETGRTPGALEI